MPALKSFATVALSVSLLADDAAALAPTASAASSDCSTYDQGAEADGINFRTGPSTSYKSKGLVCNRDQLALYCKSGSWYKAKITKRSKGGLPAARTAGYART